MGFTLPTPPFRILVIICSAVLTCLTKPLWTAGFSMTSHTCAKVNHSVLYLPSGTVIRVSTVKLLEYEKEYICARCKHVFGVQADFEQFYTIPKPTMCPSSKECNSNKFTCLSDGGKFSFRVWTSVRVLQVHHSQSVIN